MRSHNFQAPHLVCRQHYHQLSNRHPCKAHEHIHLTFRSGPIAFAMGSSLAFEFGLIMRQRPKQPFCRRIGSLFLRRLSIQYLFPNKP